MKHIPNILTGLRLVGGVLMFLFLAAAAGGVPFISEQLTPDTQFGLERWALIAFVLACLTDFFDGWLARKLNAVSALREGAAPKGIKIPVSTLAKWKTALQMVAIFAELLVGSWAAWPLPSDPGVLGPATTVAHVLLWIAAAVTFWTGAEYWHKAHVAIGDD